MQINDTDKHERLQKVDGAYKGYLSAIKQLPYPGCFDFLHREFVKLADSNFHIPSEAWKNPYELAHIANYVSLYGAHNALPIQFDLGVPLNQLKKLWALAEDENAYSPNDEYIASFVLRWIYQQLPYCIDPRRATRTCELMRHLLTHPSVSAYVEASTSLTGERIMDMSFMLLRAFRRHSSYTEAQLRMLNKPHKDLAPALELLAADRDKRVKFQREKLEVKLVIEKPYEISTLLRYPIVKIDRDYYAPYPELVGYGAARGLFFRFSEEGKNAFLDPFADAMEGYVANLMRRALPKAEVITEADERAMGWQKKTNDISVIFGNVALLFECKTSAFFVNAKRTAAPDIIIEDVRKNLANSEKGKGLIQLYKKVDAIRSKALPACLMEKYQDVQEIYPIVLLYDSTEHANAAAVVGNIIKDELAANGISGFDYQIWHLEELSWLVEFAGEELIRWTQRKFQPDCYPLGLNGFISKTPGNFFLNQIMYMPNGNTKGLNILKALSEKQVDCKGP
jgi:hypothetical protein